MISPRSLESMSDADLLSAARDLARKSQVVEADLLVHLGEIDERKLYLECAFPSMFAFCVGELGFSEDAAYHRITVARTARRLPAVIDEVREGRIHLAGMRVLLAHLTEENHRAVLAKAAGKSKRDIEQIVARLAPQPDVPATIRKLPQWPAPTAAFATTAADASAAGPDAKPRGADVPPLGGSAQPSRHNDRFRAVAPLAAETFQIQFTAGRGFCEKLREAQDLLRHRVPDGNLEAILGKALELLIEEVKKERFAVGRKPRTGSGDGSGEIVSRHLPDAIKRAVYERDGGCCTFVDERGRRCGERAALEFDHIDGFARTRRHESEAIRLLCRAHNQQAAEKMYGRIFMEPARTSSDPRPTRPGTSPPA